MQNTFSKIIAGIAVIALLVACAAYVKSGSAGGVQVQDPAAVTQSFGATYATNAPAGNSALSSGVILPNPSVYDYLVARAYAYVKWLGLDNGTSVPTNSAAVRAAVISTSTVLCSLTNPLGATSSITHAVIMFSTAPTSTLSLVVGTSSLATNTIYATSSGMMTQTVLVSATGTPFTWDPGVSNDTIGPNGVVTFGVGGGSSGTWYGVAGSCSMTVVSDN